MTLELKGKIRSTPCPKLILRTVNVPWGPLLMAITRPSKACNLSLSPSLILTCTRIWSPGTNAGKSVRFSLSARRCITGWMDMGSSCDGLVLCDSCEGTQSIQFIKDSRLRLTALSRNSAYAAGPISGRRWRADSLRCRHPSRYISFMDEKRDLFRHTLATLAYRTVRALENAPTSFADFDGTGRRPIQILAHMGDLFDWALSMAQ